jgi:retinol dehydrogenase-12
MNHCIGMAMGSVVISLATASSIFPEGRQRYPPSAATDLSISGCVSFVYSLWSLRHIYSEYVQGRCRMVRGRNSTTKDASLLQGKVVLITGSNSGIGKETAKQLFHYGASTVILACRNAERAEEAIQEILRSSPTASSTTTTTRTSLDDSTQGAHGSPRLRFLPLDLSDLQSVRDAVQTFLQWKLPLHILINNAGVFMESYQTSPQGYEITMASNHLGHFLLTYLLLPTLLAPKEEPARIINVTSSTYRLASRMEVDDLLCTKYRPYTFFGQYAQSKLANILFTAELAHRYPNTLRTYAVHPGLVRTNGMCITSSIGKIYVIIIFSFLYKKSLLHVMFVFCYLCLSTVVQNMPWLLRLLNQMFGVVLATLQKTCTAGAFTSVYCAVSSEVKDDTGYYYSNSQRCDTYGPAAKDMEVAKELWKVSAELVNIQWNETEQDVVLKAPSQLPKAL